MGDSGKVMLLPRGEYYSATPYEELDCVYYQGRSYVCKQASTGHAPTDTTYWQPMTPDASAEIQALTNYMADTGVKNLLNIYGEKSMSGNVNLTIENNGYSIAVSTSAPWQSVRQWLRGLKKNTDYVFSFNFTMESGSPLTFIDNSDGTTVATLNPSTGLNVLNFNTGNYTDFQFYFYCINGTAGTGSVHYADIMVCEKAVYDADPTYQPYAKTNVELTQDVTPVKGSFTYLGATFNYRVYPDRFVIWSNGSTTERLTASDWTAMLSNSPDLAGIYPDNVHGALILNNGDILKVRLTTGGTVGYFRVSTGAGAGTYIQSNVVMYA